MSKFKPVLSERITQVFERKNNSKQETNLYTGEKLSKSDKIFAALGAIEELLAFLGIIKTQHYSSGDNSAKLFLFARFTQIQECLISIMHSLGNSKKTPVAFEDGEQRIKELEQEIEKFTVKKPTVKPLSVIPGQSLLDANLFYARALCRRAERQICASKNPQMGLVPDNNILIYFNKLGDYFLGLALNNNLK